MKFRKGYVPVVHMKNSSGHCVSLMGTAHIRSIESWEQVKQELNMILDTPKWQLHMEGIKKFPDGTVFTDEEKQIGSAMSVLVNSAGAGGIDPSTGMMHQKQALQDLKDRFVYSDMNMKEFVEHALREPHVRKRLPRLKALADAAKHNHDDKSIEKAINSKVQSRFLLWFATILMRALGVPVDTIVNKRNEHVMNVVLAQTDNVVLFWGLGHLPGMMKILKANGYKVVNTEWRDLGWNK